MTYWEWHLKDPKDQINMTQIKQLPDGGSLMKEVSNLMTNLAPDVDIKRIYLFILNLRLLVSKLMNKIVCTFPVCH